MQEVAVVALEAVVCALPEICVSQHMGRGEAGSVLLPVVSVQPSTLRASSVVVHLMRSNR